MIPPRVFTFACAQYARHRISPLNSEPCKAHKRAHHRAPIQLQRPIQPQKKNKNKNKHTKRNSSWGGGDPQNLHTYSGAPVRIPSLCCRELGSIEPHKRGEGLRHPVGDHRHGAEHDADLQQRHRHLCSLLGLYSSRLHSTNSGEKQGRRDVMPWAACCFTRDSGVAGLFLDIFNRSTGGERVGRGRDD